MTKKTTGRKPRKPRKPRAPRNNVVVLNESKPNSVCAICSGQIHGPCLWKPSTKNLAHAHCAGYTLVENLLGWDSSCVQITAKFDSKCNRCLKQVKSWGQCLWHPGLKGVIHMDCEISPKAKKYRAQKNAGTIQSDGREINIPQTFVMSDKDTHENYPSLMKHQARVVNTMEKENIMYLAAEQGTGKTFAAIASFNERQQYPAVIVCPAIAKINWQREIKQWIQKDAVVVSGKTPDPSAVQEKDIIVINYDILEAWTDTLKSITPQAIIFDESHMLSNEDAKRTQAALKISAGVEFKMLLSGTPFKNSPHNLISQLKILGVMDKFDRKEYVQRYCPPRETRYGTAYGASNVFELNKNLSNVCMYRIRQDECIDLPPLVETEHLVTVKSKKGVIEGLVRKMKKGTIAEAKKIIEDNIDSQDQAAAVSKIRKDVGVAKINEIAELTDEVLNSGQAVVMVHHKQVQDELKKKLEKDYKVSYITGGMSDTQRQKNIDDFQNGKTHVIICSISAANTAINLYNANQIVFGEFPWTYADYTQAIARIYRKGQRRKCFVSKVVATQTFDETMLEIIEKKRQATVGAIDGIHTEASQSPLDLLASELVRLYATGKNLNM